MDVSSVTSARGSEFSRPGLRRARDGAGCCSNHSSLLGAADEARFSDRARQLAEGRETRSGLTREEEQEVRELAQRDREVRAHEQAHKAAAGQLAAGGPSYTYEKGPDGRNYAVGGEVKIWVREGDTPEETLRLAQQAQRAAQAPDQPSGQDRAVAAKAAAMANEARQAIQEERQEEQREEGANAGLDLLA